MKRVILSLALLLTAFSGVSFAQSQLDEATLAKRAARKNLVIKEWNTNAKSKTKWLDRVTTYDYQGRKIEEIEYNQYGQSWRETFEYGSDGRVSKCSRYDAKNKPELVQKFEYYPDGRKKKQYNYSPSGSLQTIKVFEYSTSE